MSVDPASTPAPPPKSVGWIVALVWLAIAACLIVGALLGATGGLLRWLGIAGGAVMILRLLVRTIVRKVRAAGAVIDNAPGRRDEP